MPQGAIVFSWGGAVPGRAGKALELFQQSVEMFDDFQKNNQIHGHWPYLSTNRSGGIWLVHGELPQLMAMQALPEVQEIQARSQAILEDWTAEWFIGGSAEELGDAMARFGALVEELE